MTNQKEVFELAKAIARVVWMRYDDEHGYRSEKLAMVDSVSDAHPDNLQSIWGMMDANNQGIFAGILGSLSMETKGGGELLMFVVARTAETAKAMADLGMDEND